MNSGGSSGNDETADFRIYGIELALLVIQEQETEKNRRRSLDFELIN